MPRWSTSPCPTFRAPRWRASCAPAREASRRCWSRSRAISAQEAGGDAAGLFDHHLQKPIDFDVLDRILARPARRRMKASPGARSWMAAGVRHELLTRALPALRHDMAAPVSVIRMGILLLKRQVTAAELHDARPGASASR